MITDYSSVFLFINFFLTFSNFTFCFLEFGEAIFLSGNKTYVENLEKNLKLEVFGNSSIANYDNDDRTKIFSVYNKSSVEAKNKNFDAENGKPRKKLLKIAKNGKVFLVDKKNTIKNLIKNSNSKIRLVNNNQNDSLEILLNDQPFLGTNEHLSSDSDRTTSLLNRKYKSYFRYLEDQQSRLQYQTYNSTFLLGYLTGSNRNENAPQYMRPGLQISGAITLAVNEINEDRPLVNGHLLDFVVAETYGQELESILHTANLWIANVSAFIGPQETCVHEARMAAAFKLPMLSYFCTDPQTSNKDLFPTFARTRPPDTQISKSVASVLKRFEWEKVTFVYNDSPDADFGPVAKTILATLISHNITVIATKVWNSTYYHGFSDNIFVSMLRDTYKNCRIYVALGFYYEFLGILSTMEEQGLFDNGEYFVVGVMLQEYNRLKPEQYLRDFLGEQTNATLQKAYQNFLGVIPTAPVGSEEFITKVDSYLSEPPFSYPNAVESIGGIKKIRAEAAYLYDAVNLYAYALNDTLKNGDNPFNGTHIIQRILGTTYRSARGYMVHMDNHGDAEGNYTLLARFPLLMRPSEFGLYPVGDFRYSEDYSGLPELHLTKDVLWRKLIPPRDEPHCGFQDEKCLYQTGEIIAGVTGGLALLLVVFLLVAYRNWKYEQELDSLLWKVDYRDVKICDNPQPNNNLQGRDRLQRNLCSSFRTSQLSLNSNTDIDTKASSVYTKLSVYKGRIVALKYITCKHVDITRKVKKELKTMRDLRHDHLLGFVGASVDPPNVFILTEYCPRGSLKDILDNEDVRLDNMFIASLVGDIVQGMIFLHDSPIKFHGNLKTSNCLVDSRWVVKIADFGLYALKSSIQGANTTESEKNTKAYDLLYRAPELLKDPSGPSWGTQKGDVYSFAIILYEVHGRNGPYGQSDLSPGTIVCQVIMGPKEGEDPFRPSLDLLINCPECVRSCLTECWAENPEERPDFRTIRQILRPMRKGLKPNIFDNMLEMMEKYANNLEALVDERTDLLIEEKKKTDALLYEMLPRVVAEQLKMGHGVEAENFDCVTIYFSDIVGFTEMSAESTALQVVDFLNDLYTCFDSIIGNYDVYKVETIGDAYMVVSGLPIRNGDDHAMEIASMSLHLLDSIKKFKIRHRPNDTLKLRIGLHSGPVCAGVVGVKMPRYCLFGDTVNTASRMESLGSPLQIHCSSTYQTILSSIGGYTFEERGQIEVKGKGAMTTFWLTGEDPEMKKQRQWKRSQRQVGEGSFPNPNGILRSSIKSSRGVGKSFRNNNSALEGHTLRFVKSEEISTKPLKDRSLGVQEGKPPTPTSLLAMDICSKVFSLEKKRNSFPCMKDESRKNKNILISFSESQRRGSDVTRIDKNSTLTTPTNPNSASDPINLAARRLSLDTSLRPGPNPSSTESMSRNPSPSDNIPLITTTAASPKPQSRLSMLENRELNWRSPKKGSYDFGRCDDDCKSVKDISMQLTNCAETSNNVESSPLLVSTTDCSIIIEKNIF